MANSSLGLFRAMHNNNPWVNNPWREDANGNIVKVKKDKKDVKEITVEDLYKDHKEENK